MCGRYELDLAAYGELSGLASIKGGEIRPGDLAPVQTADGMRVMRWGYPLPNTKRTVFNAKRETVRDLPMFRESIAYRRVVVPTTGFYEWKHQGKTEVDRYRFRSASGERLYLAGLYDVYDAPTGPEPRYAILTAPANAGMAPYHDRMPVYLTESEREAWITDPAFATRVLTRAQPDLTAERNDDKPEQLSLL